MDQNLDNWITLWKLDNKYGRFYPILLNARPQLIAIGLFTLACCVSVREYLSFVGLIEFCGPESFLNETSSDTSEKENSLSKNSTANITPTPISSSFEEKNITKTVNVSSGDTLSSILLDEGISSRDINLISKKLSKKSTLRCLQIGQPIQLNIHHSKSGNTLEQIALNDKNGDTIILLASNKDYSVTVKQRILRTFFKRAGGIVDTSFSDAAMTERVPQAIIQEASQAIAPLVQTANIQKGSAFEILYDEKVDAVTGEKVGPKTLHYVAIFSKGKLHKVYRFGHYGYYTEDGESVRNEFLVMPLKNKRTRISSRFGYRTHPILGTFKRHTGVDYAAQYGSEVCSSAHGTVVYAGRYGNYGLYIRIRHANGFETAYAHLSSIAVSKGARVKQGQTIGRVGSTGQATGPHLHHEVIRNRDYVDPLKYHNIGALSLSKAELLKFKQQQKEFSVQLAGIPQKRQFA